MKGNILKISALKKNREWCDKDHVLLCACFQILVDFIEKEKPQRIVDYKHNKEQKKQWKELQALYRFWKTERPQLEREQLKALKKSAKRNKVEFSPPKGGGLGSEWNFITKDKKSQDIYWHLEDKVHRLDDEMLHRLINIRHHLWC